MEPINQTVQNLTARLLKEEGRLSIVDELAGALSTVLASTSISKPNTTQKYHKNPHNQKNSHQDKNQDKNSKKRSNSQNSSRQMTNAILYAITVISLVM